MRNRKSRDREYQEYHQYHDWMPYTNVAHLRAAKY